MENTVIVASPLDIPVMPVAWLHDQPERYDVVHDEARALWLKAWPKQVEHYTIPLYRHAERQPLSTEAACALLKDALGIDPILDGNVLKILRAVERAHGIGHNALSERAEQLAAEGSRSNGWLEGMEKSVIINGVRFYFMHDNHFFTRLRGVTLDEVLAHADAVEAGEFGSYGTLCPAILVHGEKDVRRVGTPAHARGQKDPKDNWNAGKAKWREAMEADIDVMRLLPSNASRERTATGD